MGLSSKHSTAKSRKELESQFIALERGCGKAAGTNQKQRFMQISCDCTNHSTVFHSVPTSLSGVGGHGYRVIRSSERLVKSRKSLASCLKPLRGWDGASGASIVFLKPAADHSAVPKVSRRVQSSQVP